MISKRPSYVAWVTNLVVVMGLFLTSGSVSLLTSGCGSEPPRRPNIMHAVDERRAVEILSRVFREAHLEVERDREVTVGGGTLRVDVAAAGHKYGVAYLAHDALARAFDTIPKRDADSDALVVVDASQGDRVLVLDQRDYMTDDLEGETHSVTTIAAENKIQRDARDFVVKAVRDQWR